MTIIKSASIILVIFLVGCSSPNESNSYEENHKIVSNDPSESNSDAKDEYVKVCTEKADKSFCSCQFDIMNPILSDKIGSDWSTKNMEEKDFGIYMSAVETAVNKCS